ncbi:MAG: carboxypeptidase-like regulatory domain-containing protein, partial [Bryobacteraceae bacterium]
MWLSAFALNAAENHGQVTFAGVPVPGARVTATQGEKKLTAVTDLNGVYSFADLAEGTWTMQVEMRGFVTAKNDVAVSASPMWELKMLPLAEMSAQIQAPQLSEARPAAPNAAAPSTPAVPKPQAAKPPAAAAGTAAPGTTAAAAAPPDPAATDEVSQRAADGFLINGSSNNGASSPFGLNPAFGNNRRGGRSLYNGNIGLNIDNSALDARQFSITGQDTAKPTASK